MVQETKGYIFILILALTYSKISSKSGILDKKSNTTPIRCTEDSDCPQGDGAQCIHNICECLLENGCNKESERAKSTVIGGECMFDNDCNLEHVTCNNGICECKSGRIASSDKRKCLKIAGGLGQRCEEDIQCMEKVDHSICKNKKCECDDIHHRNKFTCLSNTDLDGACERNEDCSNIANTECKIIKCVCVSGYVPSTNKKRCLPEVNITNPECEEDSQCTAFLGAGGICEDNVCKCDEAHDMEDDSICVLSNKLKQFCETDEDCTSTGNDTMHCENGKCECLLPYYEEDGICNSVMAISGGFYAFLPAVSILYFMRLL